MWGLIHQAQLRELQFVVKGDGFVDEEKTATSSSIDYLHKDAAGRPLSLAYKVVNKAHNGQYEIEKHIYTDPDSQKLSDPQLFPRAGRQSAGLRLSGPCPWQYRQS